MSLPNPGMSFTPFDQLPASDLNDIVENVEALAAGTGLDDGSIVFDLLSTTIFSGQVTTYSNPGTAGGTFYYANIGGIKRFWGTTADIGTSGNAPQISATVGITFPVGFFSTIQITDHSLVPGSNTNGSCSSFVTASSTTGATVGMAAAFGGTNLNGKVQLNVIGT